MNNSVGAFDIQGKTYLVIDFLVEKGYMANYLFDNLDNFDNLDSVRASGSCVGRQSSGWDRLTNIGLVD